MTGRIKLTTEQQQAMMADVAERERWVAQIRVAERTIATLTTQLAAAEKVCEAAEELQDFLSCDHWCGSCEEWQGRGKGEPCPLMQRIITTTAALTEWRKTRSDS